MTTTDPLLAAAQAIVRARSNRQATLVTTGKIVAALSGEPDYDFNAEIFNLLLQLSNQVLDIEAAVASLIPEDLLAEAQREQDELEANFRRTHPDTPDGFNPLDTLLDRLTTQLFHARKISESASTVRIVFPDGRKPIMWITKAPLLGPAIEAAFKDRLENGATLFISDVETTKHGDSEPQKIILPPGTQMLWKHPATDRDVITAIAAEVEDHVQRYGGIHLDADGNLYNPGS